MLVLGTLSAWACAAPIDDDSELRDSAPGVTELAPETAPTVTPPRDNENQPLPPAFAGGASTPGLPERDIELTFELAGTPHLAVGEGSTITVTLPADADADGYFEAADDAEPASRSTIEIDVRIKAALTAGTWAHAVAVLQDGVALSSIDLGALWPGERTARVSLPASDLQVYVVRVTGTEAEGLEIRDTAAATIDSVSPAAPSTAAVATMNARLGRVAVTFNAPADAGNVLVQLAWGRSAIHGANFGGTGQTVRALTNVLPGAALDETVQGLPFDTTHHFAARAVDAAGNVGPVVKASGAAATSELSLTSSDAGWGQALSRSTGDVDGDGYADLVVGIPNWYRYGLGGFEVIYGAQVAGNVRRSGRIAPPATLPCSLGSCLTVEAGWTVNVLPDLNGDGRSEIAVVAYDERYSTDFVLIYAGTAGGLSTSAQPAAVLEWGTNGYGAAYVVDGVGDVDGDGDEDWVIALGWGAVTYLYLNNGSLPSSGLMSSAASTTIMTSTPDEYPSLAAVGLARPGADAADLVLSSHYPTAAWTIAGMASWPATIDLAEYAPAHPGSRVALAGAGTYVGVDMVRGDIDGDGDDDAIAIGEGGVLVLENDRGSLSVSGVLSTSNVIINGTSAISGVDLNLDGKDDVLTGAGVVSFGKDSGAPTADVSYALPIGHPTFAQFSAGDLIGGSNADIIMLVRDATPELTIRY